MQFLRGEMGLALPRYPYRRIDREEVARLHAHGLNDAEIGRHISFTRAGVARVRAVIGLPAQGVPGPRPAQPRRSRRPRMSALERAAWEVLPIAAKMVRRGHLWLSLDELMSMGAMWIPRMCELAPAELRNPRGYAMVGLRLRILNEVHKEQKWRGRLAPQDWEGAT